MLLRIAKTPLGSSAIAVAFVIGGMFFVVTAGGYDLGHAASALWNGSVGDAYSFFTGTLMRATPLILVGLAVSVAFKAGILNIGADGQLLAGASAAVAVGLAAENWPAWVAVPAVLAAGMLAGALWAAIAAILKRRFGVLEVISTLMLNFVALYAVSYLVRGPLEEPTRVFPQTSSIALSARLPVIMTGQRLHLGFVFALVLAVALWWILRATATGFRVRVVGEGAAAAASSGRINVDRVVFNAFLTSGAIAGLGGAVQVAGVTYALYEGSAGYGYTAIAVALLARLNPIGVIAAGVFFGALEAGGAGMQRDAGVPAGFVAVIESLAILGVLAVDRVRTVALERSERLLEERTA